MAAERSRMIKLFRSTLQERSNYSRESRLARNRAVSKTHERLARDAHKAKDDDKGRRMDALKVSPVSMYVSVCPRYSTSGSILITAPVHVKAVQGHVWILQHSLYLPLSCMFLGNHVCVQLCLLSLRCADRQTVPLMMLAVTSFEKHLTCRFLLTR